MRMWSGLGGKCHRENRAGEEGGDVGHTAKGTFKESLEGNECAARLMSWGKMQASRGDSGVKVPRKVGLDFGRKKQRKRGEGYRQQGQRGGEGADRVEPHGLL